MSRRLVIRSLLVVATGTMVAAGAHAQRPSDFVTVEVETVGMDILTGSPVVLLHDPRSDRTLPVWIGTAEAQAIMRSLNSVKAPRPMTHDLLSAVIQRLKASVEEVRVTEQRDGVFLGEVYLLAPGKKKAEPVDSRPSDAVALALRTGAPIRVRQRLLDEAPRVHMAPPDSATDIARLIGLTVVKATAEARKLFDLPERDGVVVVSATENAAAAGMRRGDLILTVNGRPATTPAAFREAVRSTPADEPVKLRVWRGGSELDVSVERLLALPPGGRA